MFLSSLLPRAVKELCMKRSRQPSALGLALVAAVSVAGFATMAGGEFEQLAVRAATRPGRAAAGAGGQVNLPYTANDNTGNQWRIYQGGWLQQSGNMPVYSQGAMLTVNGAQPGMQNNMGRLDPDTGEVVLENMNAANGLSVTRRVLIDKERSFVRYIDIVRNTGAQEQTVNLQLNSNFNYGLRGGQNVP